MEQNVRPLQTKTEFDSAGKKWRKIVTHTYNEFPTFKVDDEVVVTDGSYNEDADTKEKRSGINPLFRNNVAKVIAVDQQVWIEHRLFRSATFSTRLDLLLSFPNGEKVYCSTVCVKHKLEYEKNKKTYESDSEGENIECI